MSMNGLLFDQLAQDKYESKVREGERMAELIRSAHQNCSKSLTADQLNSRTSLLRKALKFFGIGQQKLQECC